MTGSLATTGTVHARAELEGQQASARPYGATIEELGDPFGENPFLLTRQTSAPLVRVAPGQQQVAPRAQPARAPAAVQAGALKQKLLTLLGGNPRSWVPLALATGGVKAEQVQEAVVLLERENPARAPAQEALDGVWHAVFFSGSSPGAVYAAAVGSLPETKCTGLHLEISCKSTMCVATASFQTVYGQELKLFTRSRWTAEGPVAVREQYELSGAIAPTMSQIDSRALAEAIYSTSGVPELMQENIPTFEPATEAFVSLMGGAMQPLFTWAGTQGSKVPVSGLFERMLYVSYLDSDTMVLRDIQGAATVLRRGAHAAPAQAPTQEQQQQQPQQELREAPPAPAPLPPAPEPAYAAQAPAAAAEQVPESPLAVPTSGLYAGLDPAIVAALTGRAKPAQSEA